MTNQSVFFNIFYVYMGSLFLLQIYLALRIRRAKKRTVSSTAIGGDQRLTSKETLSFGLFHTSFYLFMVIWVIYNTQNKNFPVPLGIAGIAVSLILARKPISLVLKNRPRPAVPSINLAVRPQYKGMVAPELIEEILLDKSVIAAMKKDLSHTDQIGGRERWRLGLITPASDQIDPSTMHLTLTRAAVLHSSTLFNLQPNNILILHGASDRMLRNKPGFSYPLGTKTNPGEFTNIRDIKIALNALSSGERSSSLLRSLQAEGFPLRDFYLDGDPLTTERGGTIVIDKGVGKIIYPKYYVQRQFIDDTGNLIHIGLDENFQSDSLWDGITLAPSVSERLYKSVEYHGLVPIVRYRSFPCTSEFMLPILDTPMSDTGWADLFIDRHGRAKLFIAKEKTLKEWYEMMERLRQLFFYELARKGNHLLGLTKDAQHLHEYFCKKQAILEDYFIVRNWSLP